VSIETRIWGMIEGISTNEAQINGNVQILKYESEGASISPAPPNENRLYLVKFKSTNVGTFGTNSHKRCTKKGSWFCFEIPMWGCYHFPSTL